MMTKLFHFLCGILAFDSLPGTVSAQAVDLKPSMLSYYRLLPHNRRSIDYLCVQTHGNLARWLLRGRDDAWLPSSSCRFDSPSELSSSKHPRRGLAIPLRSFEYFELLRDLTCTLRRSGMLGTIVNNGSTTASSSRAEPPIEAFVFHAPGDLTEEEIHSIRRLGLGVRELPDLTYQNIREARFGRNWLKLRLWDLEDDFDQIMVMDADMVVTEDLTHLFEIAPDEPFALTANLDKHYGCFDSLGEGQAGLMILRPCRATLLHMLLLLETCPTLRFETEYAEQRFLQFYFVFGRVTLPPIYNMMSHLLSPEDGLTWDGAVPAVVHFTRDKQTAERAKNNPGNRYRCSADDLERFTPTALPLTVAEDAGAEAATGTVTASPAGNGSGNSTAGGGAGANASSTQAQGQARVPGVSASGGQGARGSGTSAMGAAVKDPPLLLGAKTLRVPLAVA